jgi:hypothetical protein
VAIHCPSVASVANFLFSCLRPEPYLKLNTDYYDFTHFIHL